MKSFTQDFIRQVVFCGVVLVVFGSFVAFAWTGPTQAPPSGNVNAPLNVGTTDQIKDAGLGLDTLAVYDSASFAVFSGSVGIGTASPSEKLSIEGNVVADGYFHNSDARLKTDIQPISGLDIISRLRGVSFMWKENEQRSVGILAQNVENVLPEIVHTDGEGVKSVEYDALIAPLIEAIKEQQVEIEALRKELEELKREVQ